MTSLLADLVTIPFPDFSTPKADSFVTYRMLLVAGISSMSLTSKCKSVIAQHSVLIIWEGIVISSANIGIFKLQFITYFSDDSSSRHPSNIVSNSDLT